MGYVAAIAIEERVLVSVFVSVVVVLTVHYFVAVGVLVLGSSLVAFAPRSGERSKVKRGAQTKASLAADRGRLPRWACFVYFCVTTAFIVLGRRRARHGRIVVVVVCPLRLPKRRADRLLQRGKNA